MTLRDLRRSRLKISQVAFSRRFGVPLGTVKAIERGRPAGRGYEMVFALIARDPGFVAACARDQND